MSEVPLQASGTPEYTYSAVAGGDGGLTTYNAAPQSAMTVRPPTHPPLSPYQEIPGKLVECASVKARM